MKKALAGGIIILCMIVMCNGACALVGEAIAGTVAAAGDEEQYLQRVVAIAKAAMAGERLPGWHEHDDPGKRYLIPYVWGGGHDPHPPGPSTGTCEGYEYPDAPCHDDVKVGLDCSGFARWVYYLALDKNDLLDGGANGQLEKAKQISEQEAQPGDLVGFGSSVATAHHIGIYLGKGQMIDEYGHPNQSVTINSIQAPDFIGYFHYTPPAWLLKKMGEGTGSGSNPNDLPEMKDMKALITLVFGPELAPQAIKIATCESSLDPHNVNPEPVPLHSNNHAQGLFQILYPSTWNGTKYKQYSPFDPRANALAAKELYAENGNKWGDGRLAHPLWACASIVGLQ